jgi:ABC-type xylose transport system permease subunit
MIFAVWAKLSGSGLCDLDSLPAFAIGKVSASGGFGKVMAVVVGAFLWAS